MRIMKGVLGVAIILTSAFAHAQLRLPGLFSSNMVLQQNDSVELWGWANPLEKIAITTSWNNRTDTAVTYSDAKWKLKVKTPSAGGPYTISFKGYSTVELTNVMAGEVWLCSGQSNMEWNYYGGVDSIQQELGLGIQPLIRFFQVPKSSSAYPKEDITAKWMICDSNNLKLFSAVAYYFGKKLKDNLDIPIGLINASWGGTPAEVWTPSSIMENDLVLKTAAALQKEVPWCPHQPGVVYNAMIQPLIDYPLAGAIWYQGESNVGTASAYARLLTAMIDGWRAAWKRDFPFYMVQIAPYNYGNSLNAAVLREQQGLAAAHYKTGMIVVSDLVSDVNDIHPRNKKNVGARLADYALADTYKKTGFAFKYPLLKNFESSRKGKTNVLSIGFYNIPGGVYIKGKTITALEVAGEDKLFYLAESKLEGDRVIVWSKKVKAPVAVRYMYSSAGIGNLFSKEGLPVAPFRTDSWKVD